jgi:hypothetical protein
MTEMEKGKTNWKTERRRACGKRSYSNVQKRLRRILFMIRVIKSKKIWWTGHMAHIENKRKCLQVLKKIGQLEDQDLDGRKY